VADAAAADDSGGGTVVAVVKLACVACPSSPRPPAQPPSVREWAGCAAAPKITGNTDEVAHRRLPESGPCDH